MNENINLCELLRGHEGEKIYSPLFGEVVIDFVNPTGSYPITVKTDRGDRYDFESDGCYYSTYEGGECLLFPSKDQRDWNKWAEEQKPKVPKTWSELTNKDTNIRYILGTGHCETQFTTIGNTPIEKSALALLKIHQLIEVGYGGNVSYDEWLNEPTYTIIPNGEKRNLEIMINPSTPTALLFHSNEQAREFLSYPENVQLLKDFYMI